MGTARGILSAPETILLAAATRAPWHTVALCPAHCVLHTTLPSLSPTDVYERLTPAGKRPGFRTLVATQLVSGVWHGLFPGYWLFFATSAVMFEAGKTLYR